MFMGLRPEGLDHLQLQHHGAGAGGEGDEGAAARRSGPAVSGGRKWQGWKAKK